MLAAVQRPISLNCITVPVGRPLWKDVPSWFLVAEDDRMIVPCDAALHGGADEGEDKGACCRSHAERHRSNEPSSTLSATQSAP